MLTKDELILSIDTKLHDLMDVGAPGDPMRELAVAAHYHVHDLAALLSDDPEIQASVAAELAQEREPCPQNYQN